MSGSFDVVVHLSLPATGGVEVWRALEGARSAERGLLEACLVADDDLGPADTPVLRPHAPTVLAKALAAVGASRARVVLDVRRQDRLMEYAHLHSVRVGGSVPFVEQFPMPEDPVFDWSDLAARVASVPGVAQVVVRPLEAFAEHPELLAADLVRLAGLPDIRPTAVVAPTTWTNRGIQVARALNPHLCSEAERTLSRDFLSTNFPGPASGNQFLRAGLRTRILAAYEPINRKLFRTWLPELPEDSYLDDDRTAVLAPGRRLGAVVPG
jgi:hypothetical protein